MENDYLEWIYPLEMVISIAMLNYQRVWPWLLVTTGDFNGNIHSINGLFLVLTTDKGP